MNLRCVLPMVVLGVAVWPVAVVVSGCRGGGGGGGGGGAAANPAQSDSASTFRSTPVLIDVLANDSAGATLAGIALPPAHGEVFATPSGKLVYTPNPGFVGEDSLRYDLLANGSASTGEVTVTVIRVFALEESEPNDSVGEAALLPFGTTGTGSIQVGERDLWRFEGAAEERISIELFGTRFGEEAWDFNCAIPRITVMDPSGAEILRHDLFEWAHGTHDLDVPILTLPDAGGYAIRVEAEPILFAPGVTVPMPYGVLVKPSAVDVDQKEAEAPDAIGGNDDRDTAEPIRPGTLYGRHPDLDVDFYSFEIVEPTIVDFEVTAYRNGIRFADESYFDPALELWSAEKDGFLVASDDSVFFDPALSFVLEQPGSYFVAVSNFFGTGDADYYLAFDTTPVGSLVEEEGNDSAGNANPLELGDILAGEVGAEGDWFRFEGLAGDAIVVQLFGAGSMQVSTSASRAQFFDSDGVTALAASGPLPPPGTIELYRTILPHDGTYFVRVFPAVAAPAPARYVLCLKLFEESDAETELNDDAQTADAFGNLGRVEGSIEIFQDADLFAFSAVEGEFVNVALYGPPGSLSNGFFEISPFGSFLAPVLIIEDESGTLLARTFQETELGCVSGESITNGIATLEAAFVAPATGTYFAVVLSQFALDGGERYFLERR